MKKGGERGGREKKREGSGERKREGRKKKRGKRGKRRQKGEKEGREREWGGAREGRGESDLHTAILGREKSSHSI